MTDAGYFSDLFASLGSVSVRRMFGGLGVFAGGLMVAIVIDGDLYLKADAETEPVFRAAGSAPFRYVSRLKDGSTRTTTLSYWLAPEGVAEDADSLAPWAGRAYEAAIRAQAGRDKKPGRPSARRGSRSAG